MSRNLIWVAENADIGLATGSFRRFTPTLRATTLGTRGTIMKMKQLLSATALVGILVAFPAAAFAQAAPTPTAVDTAAPEEEEPVNVIVTGSRIKRSPLDKLAPTISIDAQYLENRGLTNIADALNEIPGFRGSVTPNGAQPGFGQGVNFLNSFGLGSNRTLTLINGRRVVSSNVTSIFGNAGGTQVDLNIVNPILIDRIERVSIGGAPIYGSDAIAGTVNIFTKTRFNGFEARATTGVTEFGDNFRYNISAAYGKTFAGGRGNISIAANFEEVRGVLTNDRPFLANGVGGQLNPNAALAAQLGPVGRSPLNDGRINPNIGFNENLTDGFPGTILVNRAGIPALSRGGVIANIGALRPLDFNVQFAPDGTLVPYNRGTLFAAPITSAASRNSGGDGFVFNDFTQITGNSRRASVNLFGEFQITDNIRVFGEGLYFRGFGDELIQQQSFNTTLFGGVSGALDFSVNNPLLSAQARNLLVANGYTTFRVSRINLDLGDATGFSENDLFRFVGGVDGQFKAFGRDFNFEVTGVWGRNDYRDFAQQINQQNFVNAINGCVTNPTVNALAGSTPIADARCVPLSVFGEGAPSQAARNYVIQNTVANSFIQQWVINANVGGSPFDLFGNAVSFNAGYEHREESAQFTPDPFLQAGLGRSVAIAATGGRYILNEITGEVSIPVFTPKNNFFFNNLQIDASGRYVNNSINGGFFAWSAGGSFSPIADIQFRGNFTRSFRAPSITELFSPQTNNFVTVPDLCNPANIAAGPVPATRTANCNAFLARFPGSTPLAAATATVSGVTGGNPNLLNEQANSFTYGVVVRPRFLRGFSLSVDYLNIRLTQPIANLGVAAITGACFDNPVFNAADPANGNIFCSQIRRDANGQVPADPANPAVRSGFVNGQSIQLEAIQSSLDYVTKLEGLKLPGRVAVAGELFVILNRLVDVTGVAPARSDGTVGDPQFQGQLRVQYFTDDFSIGTNANYVGRQLLSRFNRGPSPNDTREFDSYDPFWTFDANLTYNIGKQFQLVASVTNLTNRVGQSYFGIIIPGSVNDSFGRRFAMSVRVRY